MRRDVSNQFREWVVSHFLQHSARYQGPVLVQHETVSASCSLYPGIEDLHFIPVPRPGLVARAKANIHRMRSNRPAYGDSGATAHQKPNGDTHVKKMSVVTLLFDGVSRAQFHRKLPSTVKFLAELQRSSSSSVEVFEMFRYHAVGFNSAPATGAMFVGEHTTMGAMFDTATAKATKARDGDFRVPYNAEEVYNASVSIAKMAMVFDLASC